MLDAAMQLTWVTVLLVMYFLPALLALRRHDEELGKIFLLNLLVGWTLLSWGVAFVWALEEEKGTKVVTMPPGEEASKAEVGKRAA